MVEENNYLQLKEFCINQGIDLFGVADITSLKEEIYISKKLLVQLNKAISLGFALSGAVLEEIESFPTRLYFHHYRVINNLLDQIALKVAKYIQNKNFLALPIPASQIIDWHNQRGHLSHKKIGYLAGLGWLGRNNLLVNPKFGSQFRMVSILTDYPLKVDTPLELSCGECFACIKACPVSAIKEKAEDFDHLKCFEKLKEFQKQRLVDQYICGLCLRVCRGKF